MRIGINLCWLKIGKCGGLESFTRNLLDGFVEYAKNDKFVLFAAKDNAYSFEDYLKYDNFEMVKCGAISEKPMLRLVWEDLFLDHKVRQQKIDVMYNPVYSKPWTYGDKIPYITCIADLQALHYPEYFSKVMNIFMKYIWQYACKTSKKIIAISDFVKKDIEDNFPVARGKTQTIYVPVISKKCDYDFETISQKYGVEKDKYIYCVSSLLPHKNLETMLKMLAYLKSINKKEVIVLSGIGANKEQFEQLCEKYDVNDCIIKTGFITNEERDCLYDNCELFLFPSIFEGFGMPPIEAMRRGKKVVMTKKTCLEEVTNGKAAYVENPYDEKEWIEKISEVRKMPFEKISFEQYELKVIIKQYIDLFHKYL